MTAPSMTPDQDLRYPVGRPDRTPTLADGERAQRIDLIAGAPAQLRLAVAGLTDQQLDTPYRPDGWTVRQVVHHVADSHMNASMRFRLGLTEVNPTIKPYDEAAWAELPDGRLLPIEISLRLLESLHERLVHLLRSTPPSSFARTIMHPENGPMTLDSLLGIYSWHGRHHTAHITGLRARQGWG
ncbi:MAG: YfiT family bacillithiol transferase [Gemmatimonadaceae bacterium]